MRLCSFFGLLVDAEDMVCYDICNQQIAVVDHSQTALCALILTFIRTVSVRWDISARRGSFSKARVDWKGGTLSTSLLVDGDF